MSRWPEETIGVEESAAKDNYLKAIKNTDSRDLTDLIFRQLEYLDSKK